MFYFVPLFVISTLNFKSRNTKVKIIKCIYFAIQMLVLVKIL